MQPQAAYPFLQIFPRSKPCVTVSHHTAFHRQQFYDNLYIKQIFPLENEFRHFCHHTKFIELCQLLFIRVQHFQVFSDGALITGMNENVNYIGDNNQVLVAVIPPSTNGFLW